MVTLETAEHDAIRVADGPPRLVVARESSRPMWTAYQARSFRHDHATPAPERASGRPVGHPLTSVSTIEPSRDVLENLRRTADLAQIERKAPADRTTTVLLTAEASAVAVSLSIAVALLGATTASVLLLAGVHLVTRVARGSVRPRMLLSVVEDLGSDVVSTVITLGVSAALLTVLRDPHLGDLAAVSGVFLAVTLATRAAAMAGLRQSRRSPDGRRRVLIVGAGPEAVHVAEGLLSKPELGLTPVGFLAPQPDLSAVDGVGLPLLGLRHEDLGELVLTHDIGAVIATFVDDDDALTDTMLTSTRLDTDIYVVPRLYELASDDPKTTWVDGIPLIRQNSGLTSTFSWKVKRGLDRVLAAAALLFLAPVLITAAVAVYLEGGSQILFRQRRIGVDGRPFELLKFRSMRPADDFESQNTWNIADDPRVGPVGHFLRRTSVDELPQLINILRGDMSIVGPRPERPVFVEQFSAQHSRYWARHRFPVGLTGWAQVNGLRGDTSIAQRARFDNFYIANWSLGLDLKIILLTVREVLRGGGR